MNRDPRIDPRRGDVLCVKRKVPMIGTTRSENIMVLAAFNSESQTKSYVEFAWATAARFQPDYIGVPKDYNGSYAGTVLELKDWHKLVKKAEIIVIRESQEAPLLALNPEHQARMAEKDLRRARTFANHDLDTYFRMEQDIHKKFGYEEGYRTFPLVDSRDYYWSVNADSVCFADTEEAMEEPTYECELHRTRHLPQNVWRSQHHTMILYKTGADFNVHLGIFDNTKEVKS